MIAWRIYFCDGSTFDSSQGRPWEAPNPFGGVVAIVVPDTTENPNDKGRNIINKVDYYWYDERSGWEGCDYTAWLQYLITDVRYIQAFYQGRTISNQRYLEIIQRAIDDPDFTRKSAWQAMDRGGIIKR